MDYVLGGVAALITGHATPDRPKLYKKALTPKKHAPSPNVTPKSEIDDRSVFLSPSLQRKKAMVKKSPKRIFENPNLDETLEDGDVSLTSPRAGKVKKNFKKELRADENGLDTSLTEVSPQKSKGKKDKKTDDSPSKTSPLKRKGSSDITPESEPEKKKSKKKKQKKVSGEDISIQDNMDVTETIENGISDNGTPNSTVGAKKRKRKNKNKKVKAQIVEDDKDTDTNVIKKKKNKKAKSEVREDKENQEIELKFNEKKKKKAKVEIVAEVENENETNVNKKNKKKKAKAEIVAEVRNENETNVNKKRKNKKAKAEIVQESEKKDNETNDNQKKKKKRKRNRNRNKNKPAVAENTDLNKENKKDKKDKKKGASQDSDSEHDSDNDIESENEKSNKEVLALPTVEDSSDEEPAPKQKTEERKVDAEEVKRTLFVGNVPFSTKCKKEMKKIFSEYGQIDTVRIRSVPVKDATMTPKLAVIKNELHPERSTVNVYIKFKHPDSVIRACVENNRLIGENHIRVSRSDVSGGGDPRKAVFIGNMPFKISDDTLRAVFTRCGPIESVRIIRDKKTNAGKGFGYVNFVSSDGVELALQMSAEELTVEGRELRVKRCSAQHGNSQPRNNNFRPPAAPAQPERATGAYGRIMMKRQYEGANGGPPNKRPNITQPHREKKNRKEFVGTTAAGKKKRQKFDKGQKLKKKLSQILTK